MELKLMSGSRVYDEHVIYLIRADFIPYGKSYLKIIINNNIDHDDSYSVVIIVNSYS
jgi:hypothetical protein